GGRHSARQHTMTDKVFELLYGRHGGLLGRRLRDCSSALGNRGGEKRDLEAGKVSGRNWSRGRSTRATARRRMKSDRKRSPRVVRACRCTEQANRVRDGVEPSRVEQSCPWSSSRNAPSRKNAKKGERKTRQAG